MTTFSDTAPSTLFADWVFSSAFGGGVEYPIAVNLKLYTRAPSWEALVDKRGSFRSVRDLTAESGWVPVSQKVQPVVRFNPQPSLFMTMANWETGFKINFQATRDLPIPAALNEGTGWMLKRDGDSVQDVVVVAVLHAVGMVNGVRDPIICLTRSGLPTSGAIHSRSIFGVDFNTTAIDGDPTPINYSTAAYASLVPIGVAKAISSWSLYNGVLRINTTSPHRLTPGSLIDLTAYGQPRRGLFRVSKTPSTTSLEVPWEGDPPALDAPWPRVRGFSETVTNLGFTTRLAPLPYQEPASVHVWMAPQRMNYIVNPSFEANPVGATSTYGWTYGSLGSAVAALEVVPGGTETTPWRTKCLKLTRESGDGRIVLQSNRFPALDSLVSISVNLGGQGNIRLGLLALDEKRQSCVYVRTNTTISSSLTETTSTNYAVDTVLGENLTYADGDEGSAYSSTHTFNTSGGGGVYESRMVAWPDLSAPELSPQRRVALGFQVTDGLYNASRYWVYAPVGQSPYIMGLPGQVEGYMSSNGSGTLVEFGDPSMVNSLDNISEETPLISRLTIKPTSGGWSYTHQFLLGSTLLYEAVDEVGWEYNGDVTVYRWWAGTIESVNRMSEVTDVEYAVSNFDKVTALVPVPEGTAELALRIEFDGQVLAVDDVLVDPTIGSFDYFDGSSNDGLPKDFRWHGGLKDRQFSLWYNNWENTDARLFGGTNEVGEYTEGHLESWLPEVSQAIPHYDAFDVHTPNNWQGDYFYPIVDVSGQGICDLEGELDLTLQPFGRYLRTEYDAWISTEMPDPILVEGTPTNQIIVTESGAPIYFEQGGLEGSPLSLP